MRQQIFDGIFRELEVEFDRLNGANQHASTAVVFSAPHAEKQRDIAGLESVYLAHGYSMQCKTLARQIDEPGDLKIEDFSGQEIDIGALVEMEVNGKMDRYMLLHCDGGCEVVVDGQLVTVITPESPLEKVLMSNFEVGFFSFRAGVEGVILTVC